MMLSLKRKGQMRKPDRYERELLGAYERGALVSARPTKAQLMALRDAARATVRKRAARKPKR